MIDTFSKLIRLSYYGNIKSKVPDNYSEIFPPEPKPQPLEAGSPQGNGGLENTEQANGHSTGTAATAAELKWAAEFLAQVCLHQPPAFEVLLKAASLC